VAVDDQSEINFPIFQQTLPWLPNFVGFSARVLLASGAAG